MNKLDELIQLFCPAGVEFVKIGEVVDYEQPSKYIVDSTDYSDDFDVPVLTAGQTFVLGYTNEKTGIYQASKEKPVIIFDDFTGAFKWVDFPFKVKSSAMKMLTVSNQSTFLRYIYHLMEKIGFSSSEHKRLWIGTYSEFKIPRPPVPVQREIVQVLDNFTELSAELSARKKQYEYYRSTVLTDLHTPNVTPMSIGDIYDFKYGKGNTIPTIGGEYPVYGSNGIVGTHNEYNSEDAPVIGHIGAYAGIVNWATGKHFVTYNGVICKLKTDKVIPRYGYYILLLQNYIETANSGSQPFVSYEGLKRPIVNIPQLEEQERIVSILDRFDALCNDISIGLPAEIEARQKQYEYYRDKLLTFKEIPSNE